MQRNELEHGLDQVTKQDGVAGAAGGVVAAGASSRGVQLKRQVAHLPYDEQREALRPKGPAPTADPALLASGGSAPVVQCKLKVGGKAQQEDSAGVVKMLAEHKIGETGKQYLRSIIGARSDHEYRDWDDLGHSLAMRDKMEEAALETNEKLDFAGPDDKPRFALDPKYWRPKSKEPGSFVCKVKDYAKAFDAIFASSKKNRLECLGLSNVMRLRAFQKAVGDALFNKKLRRILKKEPLTIPLNDKLNVVEDLAADPETTIYEGDQEFRPGDQVVFSATELPETRGTVWQVENAVCVSYNNKGEPLFVGGGIAQSGGMTEKQIKEEICKAVKVKPSKENLAKIQLLTTVKRLSVLGARQLDG